MFTDDGTALENGVQVHVWTVRFYDNGVTSYLTVDNDLPAGNGEFCLCGRFPADQQLEQCALGPAVGEGVCPALRIRVERAASVQRLCVPERRHRVDGPAGHHGRSGKLFLPLWRCEQFHQCDLLWNSADCSPPSQTEESALLGIVGDHDYAVLGYNASNQTFTLLNPWGWNNGALPGILDLTWDQITQYFFLDGDCSPVSSVSLTAPAAPTFAPGEPATDPNRARATAGSPDSSWFTGTLLVGTRFEQFPACGFRPENTLVLISHFANSLRTMLSRIPYLTTWANGVTRHGTCFR